MDDHFCLKKALDETFFSDVVFACSDREGLQAHRAVLAAAYPDMQEADWMALFRTQPADLGRQLLYCMYSDCLPQDLTVARAKQMVAWVAAQPRLGRLSQLMSAFIEANNLKQSELTIHVHAGSVCSAVSTAFILCRADQSDRRVAGSSARCQENGVHGGYGRCYEGQVYHKTAQRGCCCG